MKNYFILCVLPLLIAFCCQQLRAQEAPKEVLVANVRDFGAKGDGKADDTVAIEKAWAFVMDTRKPQYSEKPHATVNPTLYFPTGVYRYTGKGLLAPDYNGAPCWEVKGDGMNGARIEIESDCYFITCSRVESTVIEGLSFWGGKGVFKSTWTGNMVGGKHIFHDCSFGNYTECAIGNNAVDSPYLTVYDCIFHCRDGAQAIGIAWGGLVDDSQIERCDFEQDAYHIKLGRGAGGNILIGPRNLFLSWGATRTKADIWILPAADAGGGINSGQGTIIAENKFGNENLDQAASRILIADEDPASGTDRLSRRPSTAVCETGLLTGVKLRDNGFYGVQGMKHGVVYSYLPNAALIFDHNYFCGGPHPYLIEFDSHITRLPDRTPANGAYVYSQERDNTERDLFPTELCNLPGYAIALDPYANFAGAAEVPDAWHQSADPGYTPFVALPGKAMPISGKAAITPISDAHGAMTAANVKIATATSGLDIRLDTTRRLTAGRVTFIDVELKASENSTLDRVSVMILNEKVTTTVNGPDFLGDKLLFNQRAFSRTVKLQPFWQRITIPFVLRDTQDGEFHLVIRPYGFTADEFVAGTKDQFDCGNVRVYHAKSPDSGERAGMRIVRDQDAILCAGIDPEQIIYDGTLTAPRTITFSMDDPALRPLPGTKFRISRLASGKPALHIQGITTLAAKEWCEVVYTGDRFCLVARGKL